MMFFCLGAVRKFYTAVINTHICCMCDTLQYFLLCLWCFGVFLVVLLFVVQCGAYLSTECTTFWTTDALSCQFRFTGACVYDSSVGVQWHSVWMKWMCVCMWVQWFSVCECCNSVCECSECVCVYECSDLACDRSECVCIWVQWLSQCMSAAVVFVCHGGCRSPIDLFSHFRRNLWGRDLHVHSSWTSRSLRSRRQKRWAPVLTAPDSSPAQHSQIIWEWYWKQSD